MANRGFSACDCHWCKQSACYLCLAVDKNDDHGLRKHPPGRDLSNCQDCGEIYCDACFHRNEHDLCMPPPYDKPREQKIPLPFKAVYYNLDRRDDPICLSANHYLKRAVELAAKLRNNRSDEQALTAFITEFDDRIYGV